MCNHLTLICPCRVHNTLRYMLWAYVLLYCTDGLLKQQNKRNVLYYFNTLFSSYFHPLTRAHTRAHGVDYHNLSSWPIIIKLIVFEKQIITTHRGRYVRTHARFTTMFVRPSPVIVVLSSVYNNNNNNNNWSFLPGPAVAPPVRPLITAR